MFRALQWVSRTGTMLRLQCQVAPAACPPALASVGALRGGLAGAAPARQLSGGGGSGSPFRPRHHRQRPSPRVIKAMRERAEFNDPQMQQRRAQLERGHHHYYATCHPGLEAVVAAELAGPAIGAADVHPGKAGVSFTGDLSVGYAANLWLRSAIRVLQLLQETMLDAQRPAGEEVYSAFRDFANWPRLLAPGQSFSVESRVWSCSNLSSSMLLSVRAKDAVCDAIRDVRGAKPLPPEPGRVADVPLYCTAYHDRLTIYRDMSGASLHRRGYRQAMHRASLNEAAAAGILYLTGWHQLCRQEGAVLADPMCGSGTLLIEGALMATNVAPGIFRRWWPFAQWPDFEQATWERTLAAAAEARHAPLAGVEVWGNDVHQGALSLALRDVQAAGMQRMVRLHHGECRVWQLPRPPRLVVSNPPWGQRLTGGSSGSMQGGGSSGGDAELDWWEAEASVAEQAAAAAPRQRRGGREEEEREAAALAAAWWDLSAFLKQQCGGANAFLLSGNPDATKGLRMKAARRTPLTIGGVDCRLLQYEVRGMDAAAAPALEAAAAAAARGGATQGEAAAGGGSAGRAVAAPRRSAGDDF